MRVHFKSIENFIEIYNKYCEAMSEGFNFRYFFKIKLREIGLYNDSNIHLYKEYIRKFKKGYDIDDNKTIDYNEFMCKYEFDKLDLKNHIFRINNFVSGPEVFKNSITMNKSKTVENKYNSDKEKLKNLYTKLDNMVKELETIKEEIKEIIGG